MPRWRLAACGTPSSRSRSPRPARLWTLRELISEAQTHEGKNVKHDIAVPISSIARFVEDTDALLQQRFPGVRMVVFGHLGDGNLHYNVSPPVGMNDAAFLQRQSELYATVHDQAHAFGGSISAEHGIGQLKRAENERYKSAVELRLMRTLKQALDPLGIMNPGKMRSRRPTPPRASLESHLHGRDFNPYSGDWARPAPITIRAKLGIVTDAGTTGRL